MKKLQILTTYSDQLSLLKKDTSKLPQFNDEVEPVTLPTYSYRQDLPSITRDSTVSSKTPHKESPRQLLSRLRRSRSWNDIAFKSESKESKEESAKLTIVTNCRKFYHLGWVYGSGGGMSIKTGKNLVIAPSGVEKEMMEPSDMWITDLKGHAVSYPNNSKNQMLSECTPIFIEIYNKTDAMAVIHSHSKWAVLITKLYASSFQCSELEMIKGIHGFGYRDCLEIPIIENTPREHELTSRISQAIEKYPDSYAVLVRNHGVYIWGRTPVEAKKHAECLHYLFELIVEIKRSF